MEILRAEKMGFCFGVKEAIKTAEQVSENYKNSNIYILGMLVHNKEVMKEMAERGILILDEKNIEKLNSNDVVIVRAHGTNEEIYKKLEEKKIKIFDSACVFVKKSRNLLKSKEMSGKRIIFVGDKEHPEVIGIVSHGKNVIIVADFEEFQKIEINKNEDYYMLAQTTLNKNSFNEIKEYIENNYPNIEVGDTICGATYERQKAVEKLAGNVDVMLIVGGYNSSNSKKLLNISKQLNERSYLIETKEDLKIEWLKECLRVGITAGASTPEKSIQEIEKLLKEESRDGKHGKL